jgi:hypothetical protein
MNGAATLTHLFPAGYFAAFKSWNAAAHNFACDGQGDRDSPESRLGSHRGKALSCDRGSQVEMINAS